MFRYGNPIGVLVLSVLGLIVWILGYRLIKVSYGTVFIRGRHVGLHVCLVP